MNKKEKFIFENEKGQQIEFSIWSPFFLGKYRWDKRIKKHYL